jgi:hypothetical protein
MILPPFYYDSNGHYFEEPADHGQFNFIIRGVDFDHFSLGKTADNDDPQQSLDFAVIPGSIMNPAAIVKVKFTFYRKWKM